MLACIAEVSTAYHVPVPAIERVLDAAGRQKTGAGALQGIGPMGIPAAWMPVLSEYGFQAADVRKDACWGIAAGTWILAVETIAHGYRHTTYPTHIGVIPQQDVRYADQAAAVTGVSASMILAVAAQESGFDPDAVSPAGAQGMMQFMPATWARYGVLADGKLGSPFDPRQAMLAGAMYLRHLALEFHSWKLALAGYNAGGQAVKNWGYRIPPYRQTQNYVPAVLAHYQQIVGGGGR
ncbi:transglycosylase SLT domain-containing protein [Acidithiobacillus sp. IBUN Pt1247-S3]|uniref:transglycosylase SLT domain-containing protein n=1 Tax=Acidithiobacillus sp. IBUN Pt1247-S3 TaxID=3166642 RepID=UPI0034E4B63C